MYHAGWSFAVAVRETSDAVSWSYGSCTSANIFWLAGGGQQDAMMDPAEATPTASELARPRKALASVVGVPQRYVASGRQSPAPTLRRH